LRKQDFELYTKGRKVEEHAYHAFAKQIRFEKLQMTLFNWMNDDLPNSIDTPIA